MAAEPREIELKFLVDDARRASVEALADGAAVKSRVLTSVYYDTPGRALRSEGVALRVRHDGKTWVQTLKAPSSDGSLGRGEWEWSLPGPALDLDLARTAPPLAAMKPGLRLEPVFTATVDRRAWLHREGRALIEFAFDIGEVEAGERRAAFCELEMELKGGDVGDFLAFAAKARARLGLTPSFTTKAERGFTLASSAKSRARAFIAPALDVEMSAARAFGAIARASLEQITGNAERLHDAAGPEVIHQLRVGVRRLRSVLSTFKPIVADRRSAGIDSELVWLMGELDPARNLDVLLSGAFRRAARLKADTLGLRDLGRRLRLQRGVAYARARSAIESERFAALVMDIIVWIEVGPWTGPRAAGAGERDVPIGAFAAAALERRRAKVRKAGGDLAALDRAERHRLRIAAKKLRYAADAFSGLWGRKARSKTFIGALKRLQDRLGELNDIATGEGLAHSLVEAAVDAGEADWAAGRLIGGETAREADLIVAAAREFEAFRRAKRFWPRT